MISRFLATFCYTGLFPFAPGTAGSLATVPVAAYVYFTTGWIGYTLAWIAITGIGYVAVAKETKGAKDHDPGEIVIDETSGQWIALIPAYIYLSFFPALDDALTSNLTFVTLVLLIAGFLPFRLFDIWKPWPVSWADGMNTPLGVMLDDVLAGLMVVIFSIPMLVTIYFALNVINQAPVGS